VDFGTDFPIPQVCAEPMDRGLICLVGIGADMSLRWILPASSSFPSA